MTWEGWRQVVDALGVQDADDAFADYRPRFNIAPTDQHFIVTSEFERRNAQRARWGLVDRSARDNSRASQCINAKAETLEQLPIFREAFLRRRCVVLADGFYEWTGPKSKRQPLWIHPRAGGLILFAGLHESSYPEKDRSEVTFTIVTTPITMNAPLAGFAALEKCRLYKGFFSKFPTQRNREFQKANRELFRPIRELSGSKQGTCPLAHLALAGAIPPRNFVLRSPKRQIM